MSNPFIPKTALCAGLICIAFGVSGQTSTGSTGSAGGTTQGSTPTGPGATGATTPKMGATTPATGSGSTGSASAKLAGADKTFVEKAAIGGMAEVELGNLAQQKAASEDVKKFGARMVQDHSKANDELKSLAGNKGIALPSSPTKGQQRDLEKLGKKSGADFDKDYMKHMVSDHKKDVKEFEKEAKSGKDPELQAFASKTLPTLREHLQQAESTYDAVKKAK